MSLTSDPSEECERKHFTIDLLDFPVVLDIKPDKRAENESKELIIDVPQAWDIEPDKWPECCIYKVPPKLRKVNKDAYTPMIISIGPFHHGKENLKKMEELKRRYFMDAFYQTMKNKNDLAKFIQVKEVEIRRCYAEILDFSSEDFVKMIASDSVFIIEHLWRTKQKLLKSSDSDGTSNSCQCTWRMGACSNICQTEHGNPNEDDQEKENPEENEIQEKEYPWLSYNILQDLILLENQVPFFVVEELYNSAYHNLPYDDRRCQQNEDKSFRKLVIDYFLHFWKDSGLYCSSIYKELLPGKRKEIRHFTDFLR